MTSDMRSARRVMAPRFISERRAGGKSVCGRLEVVLLKRNNLHIFFYLNSLYELCLVVRFYVSTSRSIPVGTYRDVSHAKSSSSSLNSMNRSMSLPIHDRKDENKKKTRTVNIGVNHTKCFRISLFGRGFKGNEVKDIKEELKRCLWMCKHWITHLDGVHDDFEATHCKSLPLP